MAKIARGDVSALALPDEVSEEILRGVAETSLIQGLARSRPMSANAVTLTEAEVTGANVFWVGKVSVNRLMALPWRSSLGP